MLVLFSHVEQILQMTIQDLNEPPIEVENEPFIGQTFSSLEEAYIFYKNYAEANGFTVRKDRSATRNGKAIRRDLYCHRGGKKPIKATDPSKVQRNRVFKMRMQFSFAPYIQTEF